MSFSWVELPRAKLARIGQLPRDVFYSYENMSNTNLLIDLATQGCVGLELTLEVVSATNPIVFRVDGRVITLNAGEVFNFENTLYSFLTVNIPADAVVNLYISGVSNDMLKAIW